MKAAYCLDTKDGNVLLKVRENRKRPSKSMVMEVDVEMDPIAAKGLGESLIAKAESAIQKQVLSKVIITAECKEEAIRELQDGRIIGAVKVVRSHTGLNLKSAISYVKKELAPLYHIG